MMPLVTDDLIDLVSKYRWLDTKQEKFTMQAAGILLNIQGKFAQTDEERERMEFFWNAPLILSVLDPEQFYLVWVSALLEKQIVFVSDSLGLLSSAVLGFQTLLKPFRWCLVSIPVVPEVALELVEAPMPFIAGILRSQIPQIPTLNDTKHHFSPIRRVPSFKQEYAAIEREEIDRIVVYLGDQNEKTYVFDENKKIPLPEFNGLYKKVTNIFQDLAHSQPIIYPNER